MQPIQPPKLLALPTPGFSFTPPTAEAREVELKRAVTEFAAVLYTQMFSEMRQAGKSEDDEEEGILGGGDSNMFMHLMDQEVGKAYATAGGNGLKEALYRQLSGRMASQVDPSKGAVQ